MPQTSEIIARLQELTADVGQLDARLNFQAQTIIGLMIQEGDKALDPIGVAALQVLSKNLNVSSAWLIEGKPGKAATRLLATFDARLTWVNGQAVFKVDAWKLVKTRIERLPDAYSDLKV